MQWKSMESLWLNYSFAIKIGDSFLCLLVGCYTIDPCSEPTFGRSYICCFVQPFLIIWHGSVSTFFKCSLVKSLAAKFELSAQRVITAICLGTQTDFSPTIFLIEQSTLSSIRCFVFRTIRPGKQMLQAFAVNEVFQYSIPDNSHSSFFSLRKQS